MHPDNEQEAQGEPMTLEQRVALLEHRVATLLAEVFTASQHQVDPSGNSHGERTTLKGTVDEVCKEAGTQPYSPPWHIE